MRARSRPSSCLSMTGRAFALLVRCLCTASPLPLHCSSAAFALLIRCLCAACQLPLCCLSAAFALLPLHRCLCTTAFALLFRCLCTALSLHFHALPLPASALSLPFRARSSSVQ